MPSKITATLEKTHTNEYYTGFVIRGEGELDIDSIYIEKKVPRKHRDKACWSVYSHYKAWSIGDWLFRLKNLGFDITEFKQACIEMGWEKEVKEWENEEND